jgi:Flp pilus assembly protein protease CpaA
MAFRRTRWSQSGVLFVSLVLGIASAHALFETPNAVGGGEAKMVASLFLMVVWKVVIEFFLGRWQDKKDQKSDDKPVV